MFVLDGGRSFTAGPATGAPRVARHRIRPILLLRGALLLLVVGQLGRIPLAEAGQKAAPLLVNDIAVMLVVAVGLGALLRRGRVTMDAPLRLGLVFAAWGGIGVLVSAFRYGFTPFETVFSLAYLFRWTAYFGLYLVGINLVRKGDVAPIWRTLEAAILLFAAFGVLQSAFLPGFAQIVYPDAPLYTGWDPQGRRLVSTFLDPNLAGGLLCLGLIVELALLARGHPVAAWKPLLLSTGLALTVSRSSVLAAAVGVGVLVVFARRIDRRTLRVGALLLLLLLAALPFLIPFAAGFNKFALDDPSGLARLASWAVAFEVFADHPLMGVGFNAYGFVAREYGFTDLFTASFGLDGGLLFIAVLTGLVGCAVYGCMVVWILVRNLGLSRRDPDPLTSGIALGVVAGTAALLVHSLFVNSLLYPFILEALYVLWALAYVAGREPDRELEPG